MKEVFAILLLIGVVTFVMTHRAEPEEPSLNNMQIKELA